jgi:CRP-like cAMP-binding protein
VNEEKIMDFDQFISGENEVDKKISEIIRILKGTEFFSNLDAEELDAVSQCISEKSFKAGEIIIEENTPGEYLYLIRKGKAVVEKKTNQGSTTLATLVPGQCFGDMSLIDDSPTSATVKALEDSELLLIGRIDLNVLLNWNTNLAAKMWRAFTKILNLRIRGMNEKLIEAVQGGDDLPVQNLTRVLIAHNLGAEEEKD